ncbi:hypothetical protein AB3Y40_06650 [Yoonia sp. R2331]|uniref:hypothetical protein n=1 Tax=Yoonia sp. R2331 TaxID=3237238 RepID=UPI0034E45A39
MTALPAHTYVTMAHFGDLGLGNASDPGSFDDAVDAYIEQTSEGREAWVFRMDFPTATEAGALIDVTPDAIERAAYFNALNAA